jgi:hypothetical protein
MICVRQRVTLGISGCHVKNILPIGDKWDILFQVISDNQFGLHQISHDSYHYPSLDSNIWMRSEVEDRDTEESYQHILYLFIPDSDDAGKYYKYGDASNEILDFIISVLQSR